MRTRNERCFAYSMASRNSSRRRERTMCLRSDVIRCTAVASDAAAAAAVAASSRATNWKVIVRGLKDTADRRL